MLPREQKSLSISHSSDTKDPPPEFYYLSPDVLDDAALAALRAKLPEKFQRISRTEAEQLIADNKGEFKTTYGLNFAANSTNLFFPVWLAQTGASGFTLSASLLADIPQQTLEQNSSLMTFANIIVWFNSILAAAQWLLMNSPWANAAKSTLMSATHRAGETASSVLKSLIVMLKEMLENFKNKFEEYKKNPVAGGLDLLKILAFELITTLVNFSAGSTQIFFAPAGLTWIPAIIILLLATRYCSEVWNGSVRDGIKFWTNSNHEHTSLREQLKQGNYAIVMRTFFESISTVVIRGLQYLFVAEYNQKRLGFWAPRELTMVAAIIHGFLMNYPSTFKTALGPLEQLEKTLQEKFGEKVSGFIAAQVAIMANMSDDEKKAHIKELAQHSKQELLSSIDLDASDKLTQDIEKLLQPLAHVTSLETTEKLKKAILKFHSDLIEEKYIRSGRFKLLMRDPLSMFTVILNTLFGGYAGYRLVSPVLSAVMPHALSIPLAITSCAAPIGGLYLRAASHTQAKKAVAEELNPPPPSSTHISDSVQCCAFFVTANGALASGLSAMGSAGGMVKNSALGVTAVLFGVSQKIISDAGYIKPLVAVTLDTQTRSVKTYVEKAKQLGQSCRFFSAPVTRVQPTPVSETPTPMAATPQDDTPNTVRFWRDPSAALRSVADGAREFTTQLKSEVVTLWRDPSEVVTGEGSYLERNPTLSF